MAKTSPKKTKTKTTPANVFQKQAVNADSAANPKVHIRKNGVRCATDTRGFATPGNKAKIVIDATEGFIPLWKPNVTLRWRFQEQSWEDFFEDPSAAKEAFQELLAEALLAWDDAVPVKFTKDTDNWDFQIVMMESNRCNTSGCVLASAFFPDGGRHELNVYPKMFSQNHHERVDTLIHELGHVFGLRHFFAQISETDWPSEVFGTHKRFSIMNYGPDSELTDVDKADLKLLYEKVWNGEITEINGTPIRLMDPFHTFND